LFEHTTKTIRTEQEVPIKKKLLPDLNEETEKKHHLTLSNLFLETSPNEQVKKEYVGYQK
jgi:hypothetical protein